MYETPGPRSARRMCEEQRMGTKTSVVSIPALLWHRLNVEEETACNLTGER